MRTIYINREPVRVEAGCGLRPLHQCPIQVWANTPKINVSINRIIPWHPKIYLWTYDTHKELDTYIQQVQNLCDSCYYGEMYKIKKAKDKRK